MIVEDTQFSEGEMAQIAAAYDGRVRELQERERATRLAGVPF
ncbi:MAG: hypothetical protein [Siphoviridae sp. ctpQM7]|nr:MAG: hypothetical protein [Siphoviridae sp. ctpQM7]